VWREEKNVIYLLIGLSSINSFLQNMGKFFLKYPEIETILKINLLGIIKRLL